MPDIDAIIGGSHGSAVRIVPNVMNAVKDDKSKTGIKCRRNKRSVVTLLSY